MILNKYFLEEKRFAIHTPPNNITNILQQRSHIGKIRTWWDRFRVSTHVMIARVWLQFNCHSLAADSLYPGHWCTR